MDDDMLIDIAREKLSSWLAAQEKMDGKPPAEMEFTLAVGDKTIENRLFCVFKFKMPDSGKWCLGVSGGFTNEESEGSPEDFNCPLAFSSFYEYPCDKTQAVRAAYLMAFFAIQQEKAQAALLKWLSESDEMDGEPPEELEYAFWIKGERSYKRIFFVFRFKRNEDDDSDKWLMGVAGGYPDEESLDCSIAYSDFDGFPEDKDVAESDAFLTAVNAMKFSSTRTEFQKKAERNKKSVGSAKLNAEKIAAQFVKTETRDFLTIGTVDIPSGRVMAADPLVHMSGKRIAAPVLEKEIPKGSYPVEVSICRSEEIGIRNCTARIKIKQTAAVRYEPAEATPETALMVDAFPVSSGLMCFIDADGAEVYRRLDDEWRAEHPGGNRYNYCFKALFQESYEKLPEYQRKGGDFIEWTNPENGERMVMAAAGIGRCFFRCFWGYDEEGELCELTVPMIDPDIFEGAGDDLFDEDLDDDDDEDENEKDLNTRWEEAYRANPHSYEKEDGTLLVNFALTEDTDSLFPLAPEEHWAIEGKTVNKWILSIFSLTKNVVLGTIEYHEAIKRLEKHFLAEKDGWVLIEGLNLDELEELFDGLPRNVDFSSK